MTDVRPLLERAIALEQRGDLAAARALYEQVLAAAPEHPGALLKLALHEQAAGALAPAQALLARALRATHAANRPAAPVWLAIAGVAESANDLAAARDAYGRVLAEAPDHPAANFGLGQLALREGDVRAAIERFRAVVARQPEHVPARAQLAASLLATGAADDAAAEVATAVAAAPQSAPLRHLAATIALRLGDPAGAEAHCGAGLAAAPAHAGLLSTRGHALRAMGALDRRGRGVRRRRAGGAAGRGRVARGRQRVHGGRARARRTRRARGRLRRRRRPRATSSRGPSTRSRGRRRSTPRRPPRMRTRRWPPGTRATGTARASPLRALGACYEAAPAGFACSPMMAVALLADPAVQRAAIGGWTRAALPAPAAVPTIGRRGDRLRVGYLSSDLHDHATAHLAAGLFEHHDRARIEAFAYAADRDDGSAMRRRLRAAFEHWHDVAALSDDEAARRIAADALDVLVDLKGHTHGGRLEILARRPAPVQIHYLGFPGTLAYGAVDALVADHVVAPPGADAEFAETVLRLPVCYQVNDSRRPLPAPIARGALGLPERALVLVSFNQTYKLTEPVASAWLDALREHPDAVLWLTVPHALARRNLLARAERAGVAADRIVFAPVVPQAEHLARLACADLALDVLPYGSHTTGSDALWAGVPLLTCRGTTFAGRVGASLCHAVELPELVTESLPEYARALRDALRGPRAPRALPPSPGGGSRDAAALRHRDVHARVRADARGGGERSAGAVDRRIEGRASRASARSGGERGAAQWTDAKTAGDREPLCKMSVAGGDAPSRTADAPPARAPRRMR